MRADSHETLNELFESHRHRLRRWVTDIIGRKDIAEEIVQETYLAVFRHYGHRKIDSPWALLVDIAQNKAVDHLRRRLHESGAPVPADDEIPEECRPDRLAEHEEMASRLNQALDTLSPALQQVMVMRFFQHLPREEIARKLNISLGAVEQRITRALGICRETLSSKEPCHVPR